MASSLRRMYVVGFLPLIVFDTAAQVCFKLAAGDAAPFSPDTAWLLRVATTPWIYGSIAAYLGTFLSWMLVLERVPLGPAFAASHLEVVTVLIVSAVWFAEPLTFPKMLGCGAIGLGIICLAAGHDEPQSAVSAGSGVRAAVD